MFTCHFSTRNQSHATLGAGTWLVLPHFGVHRAGPCGGLSAPLLFLFFRWLLLRWLPPGHMHGESSRTFHVHIALHRPHHFTARVHHHHDHEEHHDKHAAHVHHNLNSGQQVSIQENE